MRAITILLAAALLAGCASYSNDQFRVTTSMEILRTSVSLGPAEGMSKEIEVVVPANASELRVTIEYSGTGSGVSWSGPGACEGGASGANLQVGQHNRATQSGICDAPPVGRHTMTVSIPAGTAEATVVVDALVTESS